MINKLFHSRTMCAIGGSWLFAAVLIGVGIRVSAEGIAPAAPALPEPAIPPPPTPLTQLMWQPEHLEITTKLNETSAGASFIVTNISNTEVVIDHVAASCSCTAAKLPSQPWHLAAHTAGDISVTIDLTGKSGTLEKWLKVFFADTNISPKVLNFTVHMPERSVMRASNLLVAQADRQAVFKGDCAQCHAEPARDTSDVVLFHKVCGICHEAAPRATMVPNLNLLNHPTDYAYWKEIITNGKTNSLMPAFALGQGGPLSEAQIDDLAQVCVRAFPNRPAQPAPTPAKN